MTGQDVELVMVEDVVVLVDVVDSDDIDVVVEEDSLVVVVLDPLSVKVLVAMATPLVD